MTQIPPLEIPGELETEFTALSIQNELKDVELSAMRDLSRALLAERNTAVAQLDEIKIWLRRQVGAEKDLNFRAAFIEAYNAVRTIMREE